MVKQKQQQTIISHFFTPKPKTPSSSPNPTPSSSSSSSSKITTTLSFSPSKHLQSSLFTTPSSKRLKLSHHSHTPLHQDFLEPTHDLLEPSSRSNPTMNAHTPLHQDFLEPRHDHLEPSSINAQTPPHQNFLNKLLEPTDDIPEPSRSNPVNAQTKYTPLEKQVLELKGKYPDVILMVEVGYKYRFFGSDASVAARVLGIYAHVDHSFLTASVPTFRLNVHVRRLVSEGYKVGVVKQTETATIKAHGLNRAAPFSRGLSALYTKATIEAVEDLGGSAEGCGGLNNYLFCVVERDVVGECGVEVRIGVVGVETSTGDVVFGEFNDGFTRTGLEAILLSLSPAELILCEPLSKRTEKLLLMYAGPASNVLVERASSECFREGGALAELMTVFENGDENDIKHHHDNDKVNDADGSRGAAIKGIMSMPQLAVQALAITIRHLKQFGLERILSLGASFRPLSANFEMSLSSNTLQQLEVLRNNNSGSESGSLLQIMNHTLTSFGQRLLRHWVTHPLCDKNMIVARLDAVAEIAEAMSGCSSSSDNRFKTVHESVATVPNDISHVLSSVLATLALSVDVQRGITRILHKTATPSEFIAVIQAILVAAKQLQQLGSERVRSSLLRNLIQQASSSTVISLSVKLLSGLNKEAANKGDLLNLISIADGRFSEVGEARTKVQLANDKLESLIALYRNQLGLKNLDFITVSGTTHLIELPVNAKVPSNWVKVNSTKKAVRYHPPEVLAALDKLSLANEELAIICRTCWNKFVGEFSRYYTEFQASVQALAALDCLLSLATLSRSKNYVRPIFVDDKEPVQIEISYGRHPVVETILQDNFVPNDTYLHGDEQYCAIVTGPNMGGKSCYIRQVALIIIMAQVGSFVPADYAKLHVLDAVYTRMGASDNIQQGRSTFLEELSEASNILHHCSARSLVIMDELGRGTSTHDGVAIAYATLHYLLDIKRCMVLFVTHYPKIADIQNEFPGSVGTYHVSYLTSQGDKDNSDVKHEDVTYLYKLVPGISQRSFGFKVAQLAQLPPSCIVRAMEMATRLETVVRNRMQNHNQSFLERLGGDDEDDMLKNRSEILDLAGKDEHESVSQLTVACNKFFRNLWSSLKSDDLAHIRELSECAQSLSTQLFAWIGDARI